MNWKDVLEKLNANAEMIKSVDAPIADLPMTKGHFEKSISKEVESSLAIKSIGPVNLKAGINASIHFTKTAQAPIEKFEGADHESEFAYLSSVIDGSASMDASIPVTALGTGGSVGISASSNLKWANHRRYGQQENALAALRDNFQNIRNIFDASEAAKLDIHEVCEVTFGGTVAVSLTAGWAGSLMRKFKPPKAESSIEDPGATLGLTSSLKAGATAYYQIKGQFNLEVSATQKQNLIRVKAKKLAGSIAGLDISIKASLEHTQLDGYIASVLNSTLKLPENITGSSAYKDLVSKIIEASTESIQEGLTFELTSAINRASEHEVLIDLTIDLKRRPDVYRSVLLGDFTTAIALAVADGANGVELNESILKNTIRKTRTNALKLSIFGIDIKNAITENASVEVKTSSDGSIWVYEKAVAALVSKRKKEIEAVNFAFDLSSAVGMDGNFSIENLSWQAHLARKFNSQVDKSSAMKIPFHVSLAMRICKLSERTAALLEKCLLQESGAYDFAMTLSLSPEAIKSMFLIHNGIDNKYYRNMLWDRVKGAAKDLNVRILGDSSGKTISDYITMNEIMMIEEKPHISLDKNPLHFNGSGSLQTHSRIYFWQFLGHSRAIVNQLCMIRELLQKKELKAKDRDLILALAKMAADIEAQIGSVEGVSIESNYLLMADLQFGVEMNAHFNFHRGYVDFSV